MRSLSILLLLCNLILFSCKEKKTSATVDTTAEQITSADSNAIIASTDSLDSISLDPQTNATALQQDPPKITAKVCNPNFTLLGKPTPTHHIYYVTGFNETEFKCWNLLEDHGVSVCNGSKCTIYYVDNADIKLTKTAPHYIDPATLKSHGVGQFSHNGNFWEVKGGSIWKRSGKGMAYYNTNNHLGG